MGRQSQLFFPDRSSLVGNRERIIEAALGLFNQHGSRSVTTNHIAAHLSISPGNLYYHFRNKEEIVRAIFARISEVVRTTIVMPQDRPVSAEDLGSYHLVGIETLWNFRFLFRDLSELLARDPELAAAYRELQQWLIAEFMELLERMIAQGDMQLPARSEVARRVAINTFILWTSWVNFLTTSKPESEVQPSDMWEGALQSFLSLEPYLEPRFAAKVRAVFQSRAGK
jgi:AcrR family transcriptional regulator